MILQIESFFGRLQLVLVFIRRSFIGLWSVTSTSLSINVNGELHGYFKGKRGLRHGDLMSPYLFTLVMEVLSLMIKRNVEENGSFKYSEKLNLVKLCFVDNLFTFSYDNTSSVLVLVQSLEKFKFVSGQSLAYRKVWFSFQMFQML